MADDCFLQTRKPSVLQKHVFETKTYPHFPYFSHNMLMLSEPRRVPVICILFLEFVRFAITTCNGLLTTVSLTAQRR